MTNAHQQHGENHNGHLLLLGAAGLVGSIILAPYVLPIIGIGETSSAHGLMSFMGGEAAPGFYGSGMAGALQGGIASLPIVGEALTSTTLVTIPGIAMTMTAGALTTVLASAVIGIGGVMLANWIEKGEKKDDKLHWSNIVRTLALGTSILISLPSILTGISVGVAFLADLMSTQWGNNAAYALSSQYGLGATSMASGIGAGTAGALSGLIAPVLHLLTCGAAIIPPALALFMSSKPKQHSHEAASTNADEPVEKILWQERLKKVEKPPAHSAFAR